MFVKQYLKETLFNMNTINLNQNVIIYPNEKGWIKIKEILIDQYESYGIFASKALQTIELRRTEDGGYKDQLWHIMSDLHEMFFNGQQYFETTNILILE
jgi:hypothetical protein